MKTVTRIFAVSFFLFAAVLTINAQTPSPIDWEDAPFGVGHDYQLTQFENGTYPQDGANLSITANPNSSGINTTAKCMKFNILTEGKPWAGFWFTTNSTNDNSTPFTITADNCIVKMMVYKSVASLVAFKIEDFSDGAKSLCLYTPNTKINEWEEVTFDFMSEIGKTFHKIVIMPDSPQNRTAGSLCYVDEISFNSSPTGLKDTKSGLSMFLNINHQLQLNSSVGIQNVTIRSLNGQNLKTTVINGISGSIDMSELSAGNYLVSAKLFDGHISTQKVVKY